MRFVVVAVCAVLATPVSAGSSGGLLGQIVCDEEKPVGGAEVILAGRDGVLESRRDSDEKGLVRFDGLAPGSYFLKARAGGFAPHEAVLKIEAGKTRLVRIALLPKADFPTKKKDAEPEPGKVLTLEAPAVEVTGKAPVIDYGTGTGLVMDGRCAMLLPVGQDTESLVALAPGSGADHLGVTLRGATSPENTWLIDGFDTTDVGRGLATTSLPAELVRQVAVRTGGYGAAHGGAGGGVVDVVTRSGGDAFFGDVFLGYWPGVLAEKMLPEVRDDSVIVSTAVPVDEMELGVALGGPLVEDKAWFFVGLAPGFNDVRFTRHVFPLEEGDGDAHLREPLVEAGRDFLRQERFGSMVARVDLRPSDDQSGMLAFIGNPQKSVGVFDPSLIGDEAAVMGSERTSARNLIGSWRSRMMDGRLVMDTNVGYQFRRQELLPLETLAKDVIPTRHEYPYLCQDLADLPECSPSDPEDPSSSPCAVRDYLSGPFWVQEDSFLSRASAGATFTRMIDGFGFHAVSWGARADLDRYRYGHGVHGGVLRMDLGDEAPARYVERRAGTIDEDGEVSAMPFLEIDARGLNAALFLEDSWEPIHGLRLDIGVRLESQLLGDSAGVRTLMLPPTPAPRIGAVWDWTGEGLARLHAHVGRYQQRIPLNVVARTFGEFVSIIQYLDEDGVNMTPSLQGVEEISVGAEPPWIQPNLRAPYHDEISLGLERVVTDHLALGVTLVRRTLGRLVEDVALDDTARRFAIINPGEQDLLDAAKRSLESAAESGSTDSIEEDLENIEAVRVFPRAERTYQAIELTARTSPGGRWLVAGSLVLSRLDGNYAGYYSPQNEQLDPTVTSQFDLPELVVNSTGPLRLDRPVRLGLDAFYQGETGLGGGVSFRYSSGRPIDVLGTHALYGRREVFILPRGAGGRTPPLYDLDLSIGYAWNIGEGLRARFGVTVSNLLNLQRPVEVDDAYTYDVVEPLEGGSLEDIRDEDGGSTLRNAQGDLATPNTRWGEPRSPFDLQPPRRVKLGLIISF